MTARTEYCCHTAVFNLQFSKLFVWAFCKYSIFVSFIHIYVDVWRCDMQWSHALAEPLIQLGPGGPVITVERHCIVLGTGCVVAGLLQQQG